jgi:UDP-GlcNAc:undecaprenyl-phosphate GlcNAc-1-phosphate transferase
VLLIRTSLRWGLVDLAGLEPHKADRRRVPNTGGIAIFWSIAGPMAGAMLAVWMVPEDLWYQYLPGVAIHLRGLRETTSIGGGVLAAMAVLHWMGLYDDRRPLGPMIKLSVQTAVAIALTLMADMRVLDLLGNFGLWGEAASVAISVLWIIVVINAFNFLDNMDGLSAGVAAVCAAVYLAATLYGGQWFVAAIAALLLGALLGFLLLNFPPAKIFMGDGGSLVVGLLIAVISVRTTYFETHLPRAPGAWYGVLMPLMVLAIPLYDFISVTVIRTLRGKSPFVGDQNHFSHRLVRLGMSKRAAVGVILMLTAATGISGVMLGSLNRWQAILAGCQTLAILLTLALLERSTIRRGEG